MNRNNALDGALIADAASMGLHWLYDQAQIRTIEATGDLLFRQPDLSVYKDKKGYFAHAKKRTGELSHYGESMRIVGQLVADATYNIAAHQRRFFETFGPCGHYVGYADRPTQALIAKVILEGEDISAESGMDDNQMPAFCVIPGLFAGDHSLDSALSAAQVISINTDVVAGAATVYRCLQFLMEGIGLAEALHLSAQATKGKLGNLLQDALQLDGYQPLDAATRYGLACNVHQALPVAWHLLKHAVEFESVVRDNVRCGGDNCGRSVVIGAIAGLVFEIPASMRSSMAGGRVPIFFPVDVA